VYGLDEVMPNGKESVKVKEDHNPQNFIFFSWSLDIFKLRHSRLDPEIWVTLTKAKKSYAAALGKDTGTPHGHIYKSFLTCYHLRC
jgi:hypothetical protein